MKNALLMTPEQFLELARAYVAEGGADTVEIAAFVEWYYRRVGRPVAAMELLEKVESK